MLLRAAAASRAARPHALRRGAVACRASFAAPMSGQEKLRRLRVACACFSSPATRMDAARLAEVKAVLDLCLEQDRASGAAGGGLLGRLSEAVFGQSPTTGEAQQQTVSYVSLHEDDNYAVGVFCLSAGAVIPMHNHPDMVVLSRLLYGQLAVRAMDWVPPATSLSGGAATLVRDEVQEGPCATSALFPSHGGNLHELCAQTAVAFLDVIAPPYCAQRGRDATYYRQLPVGEDGAIMLQPQPQPRWFSCRSAAYRGPRWGSQ